MTNLRKINIWALLVPLLGLKIYAVNVEGKLPLPGMLAMLAVSLLALAKVEQQVSAKAAFQQGLGHSENPCATRSPSSYLR